MSPPLSLKLAMIIFGLSICETWPYLRIQKKSQVAWEYALRSAKKNEIFPKKGLNV